MAYRLLGLCKMLDKRLWGFENPLRQFTILKQETLVKLEEKKATVDRLRDMTADEIGKKKFYPRLSQKSAIRKSIFLKCYAILRYLLCVSKRQVT